MNAIEEKKIKRESIRSNKSNKRPTLTKNDAESSVISRATSR